MLGVAVIFFGVGAASAPASLPLNLSIPQERLQLSWDVNVEGGYGLSLPLARGLPLGRLRVGAMLHRFPWYGALGPTYEISPLALASFGAQGELLHLGIGVWGQLGGSFSTAGRPGVMFAVGWSIIGIEAQWRAQAPPTPDWIVLAKIRLPVEFIVMAIQR